MIEISFEYWNKLASQLLTISSLLGGFSIAVIANLLVSELNTRLSKSIMVAATLAACFLLINVFAMTSLILKTTEGYPLKVIESDFKFEQILGMLTFFLGMVSLIVVISLAGWTKSKKMGLFTSGIGVLTLLLILVLLT